MSELCYGVMFNISNLSSKGYGFVKPDNGNDLSLCSATTSLFAICPRACIDRTRNKFHANTHTCHMSFKRTDFGHAGEKNVFFHINGKGNKNVKSISRGHAVQYTQGVSTKGVCAENITPITGGCDCVCVCVRLLLAYISCAHSSSCITPHTHFLSLWVTVFYVSGRDRQREGEGGR
jgi:cold shock CspA family protein